REDLIVKLTELNVTALDYVIATHPHADHMGSMNVVIDTYDIKNIMMPDAMATTVAFEKMLESISRKGLRIQRPVPGESVSAGNIALEILAPNSGDYKDVNDYSIVARLLWGETSFLFTGDAEALSEKEILDKGFDVSADVLKVGHHGSVSSTSDEFLEAVNPTMAVISCGQGNTYGHPHTETSAKLTEKNITVYRTDTMGTITMSSDGENITVTTEK
ncbi:MAG: MBL fold metallo-hydrolase, partial [Clostridiales bacterium]|nr:MBL fold metallo-hydrolase [Clostridiales bacterium]